MKFEKENQYWKRRNPNHPNLIKTQFKKGDIPWDKNLKGIHLSLDTEFKKGVYQGYGFKKGNMPWDKGIKRPKFSLNHPMKNSEIRKRHLEAVNTKEFKKKMGLLYKRNWQKPEYRDKTIKAILKGLFKRPTSLEKKFIEIIEKYNLPYKYVGDGSFLIGFKNPDFVNIDGEKICIETANRFHHQGDWAEKRIEYLKRWGWKCLVVWEDELINEEKLIKMIRCEVK